MATERDKGVNDTSQSRNLKEREALNNAYAALVGQQLIQSFNAFTFEEALDAQIEAIEGKSASRRPNLLERLDKIEQDTLSAIASLKDIPPEKFIDPSNDDDVNTDRDG
jgi:hypothetical protein